MAIRKIIFVLASIIVLVGASQLVVASPWLRWTRAAADSSWFYMFGLFGILFGVVLLIAVMERAIEFRLFMVFLALLTIASGVLLLSNPGLMRDFIYNIVLDRPRGFQLFVVRGAGILRMLIGVIILYALIHRPAPQTLERDSHMISRLGYGTVVPE